MNEYRDKFIKLNQLKIFNIDAHKLRGKNFFKNIFNYREKIYKNEKRRIKGEKQFKCNLCSARKGNIFLSWKENYKLIQCKTCSAVSANLHHKDESKFIKSVYNNKNYTKKAFLDIYKNYNYRKKNFGLERFNYCIKRLNLSRKSKVLDLGCGMGYFVAFLKSKKINVKGLEPSKNIAEFCKKELKLNVSSSKLKDEVNNSYNLITLFDVLEHLKNPINYLKLIREKLKPGGYCVMYTPNIHSFAYALMGSKQNTMLPFEHLSFFDNKSINHLAKKSKFKVFSVETFGWDLMDYMLLKEYEDKFRYSIKFKELCDLLQSILDKQGLSNHYRITFKK